MARILGALVLMATALGCRPAAPTYKTVVYAPSDERPRAAIVRATDFAIRMRALTRRNPQHEVTHAVFNPNNAEWTVHFMRKAKPNGHEWKHPPDGFTVKIDTHGKMELFREKL